MGRLTGWRLGIMLATGAGVDAGSAAAQAASDTVLGVHDTLVTPSAQYAAGGFHRWLFGSHYRDLWTTPVRVPILDLSRFAGGLRPTERGAASRPSRCASRVATAASTRFARWTRIHRHCCPLSSSTPSCRRSSRTR